MLIKIINEKISIQELQKIAEESFGELVKAVVDIEKGIMAIGGELHADEEAVLIEQGSSQEKLWGINIYPYKTKEELVEFDSMINIRPSVGNRSRGVDNPQIREKIINIVYSLVK